MEKGALLLAKMGCFMRIATTLARRDAPHKQNLLSSIVFAAAVVVFAMQCAGLSFVVQQVGCDMGRLTCMHGATACQFEKFLAALAVPNVPGYVNFDKIIQILFVGLVYANAIAIAVLTR